MTADLHRRLRDLEAEVASLRTALDESTPAPATSRRHLLRAAAAGAVGVVGGAACWPARPPPRPASRVLLGQANTADAVTSIENNGPFPDLAGPGPIALELRSPGGHLHFVGSPGDAILGTYPDGTLAYNGTQGLHLQTNNDFVRVAQAGFGPLFVLPQPIRLYDSRTLHIGGTTRNGPISGGEDRPISIEHRQRRPDDRASRHRRPGGDHQPDDHRDGRRRLPRRRQPGTGRHPHHVEHQLVDVGSDARQPGGDDAVRGQPHDLRRAAAVGRTSSSTSWGSSDTHGAGDPQEGRPVSGLWAMASGTIALMPSRPPSWVSR